MNVRTDERKRCRDEDYIDAYERTSERVRVCLLTLLFHTFLKAVSVRVYTF